MFKGLDVETLYRPSQCIDQDDALIAVALQLICENDGLGSETALKLAEGYVEASSLIIVTDGDRTARYPEPRCNEWCMTPLFNRW